MPRRESPREIPTYLATEGRTRPRTEVQGLEDLLTRLVWLRMEPRPDQRLKPAQGALLDAVRGGSLTLADAAVYLRQPALAIRILTCDLMDLGLVQTAPPAAQNDVDLMKRVLHGLRKLKDTAA
ncbi:DUF742 domain-containing protein (plasmid) [Streptomyces globisporus]|uniref:DUF742 domain-containing protein n=1 Tax=Streptomyces globisporus TaxID=1908 RepID=UPI002F90A4A5|nr:DUF742 domain-containing protein [Streptomyces globisporus]